jgi:galactokinase
MTRASDALAILRRHGFPDLTSYRDLEHRDLDRALNAVPDAHAPIVRYLVTENRRVQKLVAAVRRRDWQMMGALMFMSHAVQRDDWRLTSPESNHVVAEVEAMSLEGLYGARATGRTGAVLIAGQPFVIPNFLDRIQSQVRDRFQAPAHSLLL